MEPDQTLAAAKAALTTTAERFAELLEGADVSVAIPGSDWTVRDAAFHLAGGNLRYRALANGAVSPIETLDKAHLDARARGLVTSDGEHDPKVLAAQIRSSLARYLAVSDTVAADQLIHWHAGLRPTLAGLVCFSLGEYLLHGYDVATALDFPWPIDSQHA